MTRSRVISVLLGVVLVACVGVIAADQAGVFGNEPFPGASSGGSSNPYNLPPGTDSTTPSSGTEITPTDPTNTDSTTLPPVSPTDNSGYGDLK